VKDSKLNRIIFRKLRYANSILDVGCGDGDFVNFLAKRTRKEIIGFDISNSGVIYLDNAATSLTPEPVIQKMQEFYHNTEPTSSGAFTDFPREPAKSTL